MAEETTSKPYFSFKELVYLVSVAAALISFYYSLKMEFHEALATQKMEIYRAISTQQFDKELITQQMAQLNKRVDDFGSRMIHYEMSPANKPKETKIEIE